MKKLFNKYWTVELFKNSNKESFIIVAPMCLTKQQWKAIATASEVNITSKSNFSKFKLNYLGVKVFYSVQSNQFISTVLNRAISNSTFDFFNLYKNIPPQKLKSVMVVLIKFWLNVVIENSLECLSVVLFGIIVNKNVNYLLTKYL